MTDADRNRNYPRVVRMEDDAPPESKAGRVLFYLLYRHEIKSDDKFVAGIDKNPAILLWTSDGIPERHINFVLRDVDEVMEVFKEIGRHTRHFPELKMWFESNK